MSMMIIVVLIVKIVIISFTIIIKSTTAIIDSIVTFTSEFAFINIMVLVNALHLIRKSSYKVY